MNNEEKIFKCDNCGEDILGVESAWLEWYGWYENGARKSDGLRIVHHAQCNYDIKQLRSNLNCEVNISDMHLDYFTGIEGLMSLLAFLDKDEHYNFVDNSQVLEVIKRIHIPGYEEARNYIDLAIAEGVYQPNRYKMYPYMTDIDNIIRLKKEWDW